MKLRNLLLIGLGVVMLASLALFSVGCSGDNKNSLTGPDASAAMTYDQITVALDRIDVKYDCDYDPAGVTQPGDFYYYLNVDTLSDDGKTWLVVSKHTEVSASISNGGYKNISGQAATFKFPRLDGKSFRVRMGLREQDTGGNDFNSTDYVTHVYSSSSSQMYAPKGSNYTTWNNSTKVGTISWNVNKRDRSYVLGVLTVEGCNATLKYSVTVREAK